LGIWVEEIDALFPNQKNRIVLKEKLGDLKREYSCNLLCDLLHSEGAEIIAEYGDDFYAGMPVVTRNNFGKGQAWYVASSPEPAFLKGLVGQIAADKGIKPLLETPPGVEAMARTREGETFLFIMNHNHQPQTVNLAKLQGTDSLANEVVSGSVEIPASGLRIISY